MRYSVRKPDAESELNLIPIMNLFVAMIPFLLMSASFFHLSVVNASIPTVSNDDTVFSIDKQSVNMTLQLRKKGFKLSGGNEALSVAEMEKLKKFLPKRGKVYPLDKLVAFLMQVKQQYPRSNTLVIVPDKRVKYQTIIQVMDAARSIEAKDGGKRTDLFPNVVVSSLVE